MRAIKSSGAPNIERKFKNKMRQKKDYAAGTLSLSNIIFALTHLPAPSLCHSFYIFDVLEKKQQRDRKKEEEKEDKRGMKRKLSRKGSHGKHEHKNKKSRSK